MLILSFLQRYNLP